MEKLKRNLAICRKTSTHPERDIIVVEHCLDYFLKSRENGHQNENEDEGGRKHEYST